MFENQASDSYIAHFREDRVILDLVTQVNLNITMSSGPPLIAGPAQLPSTADFRGIDIRAHTLAVKVTLSDTARQLVMSGDSSANAHLTAWKEWLFDNNDLDKRITSVSLEEPYRVLSLDLDESIQFLKQRRSLGSPIKKYYFNPSAGDNKIKDLVALGRALGPELRALTIRSLHIKTFRQFVRAISILDSQLPNLATLDIAYDFLHRQYVYQEHQSRQSQPPASPSTTCACNAASAPSLAGMANLRSLALTSSYGFEIDSYIRVSPDCRYVARAGLKALRGPKSTLHQDTDSASKGFQRAGPRSSCES